MTLTLEHERYDIYDTETDTQENTLEHTILNPEVVTAVDVVNAMGEVAVTAAFDQMSAGLGRPEIDPSPGVELTVLEDALLQEDTPEEAPAEMQITESDVTMHALITMMNYQAIERNGTPIPLLSPLPSAYMDYRHN